MSITPKDKRDEVEWRALQARIRELEQENARLKEELTHARCERDRFYKDSTTSMALHGELLKKLVAARTHVEEALGILDGAFLAASESPVGRTKAALKKALEALGGTK